MTRASREGSRGGSSEPARLCGVGLHADHLRVYPPIGTAVPAAVGMPARAADFDCARGSSDLGRKSLRVEEAELHVRRPDVFIETGPRGSSDLGDGFEREEDRPPVAVTGGHELELEGEADIPGVEEIAPE